MKDNIYIPKDDRDFANIVADHAHRHPSCPIGDLLVTGFSETGSFQVCINLDVYNKGRIFAVMPDKFPEFLSGQYKTPEGKQAILNSDSDRAIEDK